MHSLKAVLDRFWLVATDEGVGGAGEEETKLIELGYRLGFTNALQALAIAIERPLPEQRELAEAMVEAVALEVPG